MIIQEQLRPVTMSGGQRTAQAQIKASGKLFNFFSSGIYSNKPRAICRELVCNAVDSHTMAGKGDVPCEVWLPTLLDPVFRVKDRGIGMSEDFVFERYLVYAEGSTKDGSDEVIGGFGVGKAAVFSYIDQFTLTSIHDAIESVYSVYIGGDGIPAVTMLGQRPTTEGNGVEVSFAVNPDDFTTFEQAAFEALRYFEPLPDIKNAQAGAFELPDYATKGDGWAMRKDAGDLHIIMGGVRYPVETSNLTYKFDYDSPARKLLRYGLDLRVPIGTCSVALSREALSYDDRTVEGIRTACEAVIDEVAESFSTMFDYIESPWDARVALYKEIGPNAYSERGKFLAEHAKWKGVEFDTTFDFPMLGSRQGYDKKIVECRGFQLWMIDGRQDRRGRGGKIKTIGSASWEYPTSYSGGKAGFVPGVIRALIIDDLPQSPKHKAVRKIKEFAEPFFEGKVMVIRPDEDQNLEIADILKAFGAPPETIVTLTSSMPEPFMERTTRAKNANRPKVRMFTFDGSPQKNRGQYYASAATNINPGQFGRKGVEEVPYDDQPDSGILVVMDKFDLPAGLHDTMEAGLVRWDELRFVNLNDAKKLKKGDWADVTTVFERRKKAALAEYPQLAARLAVSNSDLRNIFDFFRRHPNVSFRSNKPLGRVFKIYQEFVEPLDCVQRQLARFVVSKLPARVKPADLLEQFNTKQWKAARLLGLLNFVKAEDMQLFQENL